jgi:transposase InsO family protein
MIRRSRGNCGGVLRSRMFQAAVVARPASGCRTVGDAGRCGPEPSTRSSWASTSGPSPVTSLDNAVAEAFNFTIKVELIHRTRFTTHEQARAQISIWITTFYNPRRRHSACDGMSPDDYERFIAQGRGSTQTS